MGAPQVVTAVAVSFGQTPTIGRAAVGLGAWDWVVLGAYGAVLVAAGWWFGRRGARDQRDYFLASRSLPAWAVAISTLATMQSAATFVGVPESAFRGDLTYLSASIAPLLAAAMVCVLFLPVYYARNVGTPYELLESRFGPSARVGASWAYIVGRLLASGARTFIGALPLSLAIFGDTGLAHVLACIGVIMLVATVYTLSGGVRSIVYTDVVQVVVYLGAAVVALVVLWRAIPADGATIVRALADAGKLRVVDTSLDLSKGFTLLSALTGLVLLNLGAMATDQDMVQRSLTCRSSRHAARSVAMSTLLGVPVVVLFLAIGLLLWVYYSRPDLMGVHGGAAPAGRDVFASFILTRMPEGARGLMLAGVLAIGPIGINATLNSMASTVLQDAVGRGASRDGRAPRGGLRAEPARVEGGSAQVRRSRAAVVGCGVALSLVACGCAWWQEASGAALIDFAMQVMAFAYAGLLGVFLCAVLTRRGSAASAVAALITGFAVVVLLQPALGGAIVEGLVGNGDAGGASGDRAMGEPRGVASGASTLTALNTLTTLAFPHQLTIGTIASFVVCAMGARKRGDTP
jgi:Na+/proline symporter